MTDESSTGFDPDMPSRRSRQDSGAAASSSLGRFGALIKEIAMVAVIALVVSFLIKTFLVQAFWIPSGSMENTLQVGDRVLVSKIQAGPADIDRGDVIVFEDPNEWLPAITPVDRGPFLNGAVDVMEFVGLAPTGEGNHLIKRVIGFSGDHVVCCDADGRITVNDQPLDEAYLYPGDAPSTIEFDITVPQDSLWVMGDHRSNSADSRVHDDGTGAVGSVPMDNVVGQAFVLVWPLNHLDWLSPPDTLSQIPAP